MAKSSRERPSKVEIQKGAISLAEQETYKFMGRAQATMQDVNNMEMRRRGQTMDFHTPKR